MSNAADVIIPPGTTHHCWTGGSPEYYKRVGRQHLNQVSEEWETRYDWFYWDFKTQVWEPVGYGFSPRRLKEL